MKKYSSIQALSKMFATAVLITLAGAVSAQTNLVVNPGFSSGTQGWSTGCSIEINPETVYGGSNSANPVTEIDIERCFHQEIVIPGGAIYDFSYKASRRQAGTPATVGINVRITGVQSGTEYINTNKTYTNTSWNYTSEQVTFTIPANTTDTRVRIEFSNYITTGTYGTLIDDVSFAVNAQSAVLPLKLTGFTALLQGNQSELSWTADNENNDGYYFIIEKAGRQNTFDSIGKIAVKAVGRSYSFADKNLLKGINQYRLKAVNHNGTYTYSKVVTVDNATAANTNFTVYPNPATSSIRYSVNSDGKKSATVSIFNINGALIMNRKVELNKGANSLTLDITSLQRGSFYLKVADNDGTNLIRSFCKS